MILYHIFLLTTTLLAPAFGQNDCKNFFDVLNSAKVLNSMRDQNERNLQLNGFVLEENDLEFFKSSKNNVEQFENAGSCDAKTTQANILNTAAKLIADRNQSMLRYFEIYASCLGRNEVQLEWHPKYRAINGYGNNLKHPHWGTPGAPFGRFGHKNYDDGVYSIRKSITGSELPSARKLVVDVLLKAEKFPRTSTLPNTLINLLVLYVSHDLAHQVPTKAFESGERIRCCTSGNKGVLSPSLSNSACLPISIGEDDPFYKNIRCLNMVRSEPASLPTKTQFGEVKNMATAFLDHSIIYGIDEEQTRKIRNYCGGKLKMGANNILPIDDKGKYVESSERLTVLTPFGAVWAVIFARNHNSLAGRLAFMNPHWNDEIIFQEARRINIAWLQHGVISGKIIENIFSKKINETYNENVDPSTTLEFNSAAYRFLHYFSQSDIPLMNTEGQTQSIPISDSLGRIDILENNYSDVFRGLSAQPLNFNQYSDELFKVVKKSSGVGSDILSMDIQRCRDQGLPTFLQTRRQCGFNAEYKVFDDMTDIFPQSYIEILKNAYDSVEDIDLYVGGALETFVTIDNVLLGATFGCVIGENYRKVMAGDSYFYNHPTSPYPFTNSQLEAIRATSFNQLICENLGWESTKLYWFLVDDSINPQVSCDNLGYMDLSPWFDRW